MLLLGLMYMPMMILRLLMLRKRDMGLGELREISRCWRLWVHIMIGVFKEMFFRKREKRQPSKNTVERWVYWMPLCIVDDKNTPGKRSFRAGKVELSTAKACSIFFSKTPQDEVLATRGAARKQESMMKWKGEDRKKCQVEVEWRAARKAQRLVLQPRRRVRKWHSRQSLIRNHNKP